MNRVLLSFCCVWNRWTWRNKKLISGSFLVNLMSVLMPLREFGLFMGLCPAPLWFTSWENRTETGRLHDLWKPWLLCKGCIFAVAGELDQSLDFTDLRGYRRTWYFSIFFSWCHAENEIKVMYPMALVARERWKFKKLLAQEEVFVEWCFSFSFSEDMF